MLRPLLCITALYPLALQAENAAPERFFEVGVGIIDESFLTTPRQFQVNDSLIPVLSVGVGYDIQLKQDWQLQTSLSISHAKSDRFVAANPWQMQNADLENTGIWVDTRLKYTAMFDGVNPFVSLGAGRVYGNYRDEQTQISGWETGYRAFAGLEFDVSQDMSFSLAVGTADVGHID